MRFAFAFFLAILLIALGYHYLFVPAVPPRVLSISSAVALGQLDGCLRKSIPGLALKSECGLLGKCRPGKTYGSRDGGLKVTVQQLLTGSELKVYSHLPLTLQHLSTYQKCTENGADWVPQTR